MFEQNTQVNDFRFLILKKKIGNEKHQNNPNVYCCAQFLCCQLIYNIKTMYTCTLWYLMVLVKT